MKRITLLDFEINRTKKTNRWLGLLSVCMMFLVGQLSFAQVQVGYDTTASYNAPFSNLWGYSYTQSIYTSAELSANAGTITAINYYYAGTTTLNTLNNFTLYIGHTTQSNFSSTTNWVPFADLTEVFSGGITATGAGWVTITLDTPFVYDGTSNLVIAFDENQASYTSSQTFRYSATGNAKTIQYRNDSTNPDPATPPTASVLHNFVANTQFVGLTSNLTAPSCLDTAPTFTAASAGCGNLGGTFSWTAPSTGFVSGYKVYIGTSAGNYDVVNGTVVTGLSYTMANSAINTTYYYSIVPTNPAGDAMACDEYSFTTASNICYCTPTTTGTYYFSSVSTTGGDSNISLTKTAKDTGGYGDYTSTQIVSGFEGQTIQFNMAMNTSTHYFYVWIDFNGNGLFTDAGENVVATTSYLGTYSGTLTIPTLPLGDYRIRIGSSWSGAITSCGSANGEYQDFTLTVVAPPPCMAPTALAATNITPTAADLGWTGSGTAYDIEIIEAGTTPTGTPTYTGATSPFTTTIALTPATDYVFYVRQNCGGTESTWTGPFSFTTECLPPSITGTTPGSVCGQGEIELSATADAGASIGWYAAQTGGTKLAEGATFTTPLITETTTFYVEAGNPIPNVIGQIGTTTTTSTSGGSSPYYHGWGGVKTQYIYKAEELIAAGLAAGEITSIAFDATTSGSALNNFTLHIGTTEATLATSTHIAGLDLVYSNASQAITVGLNTYTFTTPFVWDGSSNIVVQTSYSNNNTGGTSSSVRYHLPGSTLTTYTYADNKTAAQILATMTGNVDGSGNTTTSSNRANAYFNGTGICSSERTEVVATVTTAPDLVLSETTVAICEGETTDTITITTLASDYDTYAWEPTTGVSGDATNGWTFNPTETTTYTLTASNSTTECATSVDFEVTVNDAPAISVAASATEICEGASTELAVTSLNPITYCNSAFTSVTYEYITNVTFEGINNTSAGNTGGPVDYTSQVANVTAGTASTLSVTVVSDANDYVYAWIDWNQDGVLNGTGEVYTIASNIDVSGTYTLSITPPATALNGNTRMRVMIDWNGSTPNPCKSATYGEAEDYTVNVSGGVDLYTYSWSDGTSEVGTASTLTVTPTTTTTYTVTATNSSDCSVTESVVIMVNEAPQQPVIACYETATFNPAICDWEITGTQPAAPTDLACYETATFDDVTCAWVVTGEQPAAPTDLACYESATFDEASCAWVVTGTQPAEPTDLACYETATFNDTTCAWEVTGTQPAEPTDLACYETATFDEVSCAWEVTGTAPATPTADSPQPMAVGQTVAEIVVNDVTGTLNWYSDEDLTSVVDASTELTEGTHTFWVTQTIEGCESDAIQIVVEVTLSTNLFDNASFRTYPNPVRDFFNISYSKDITNVSVVNMLGQTVITKAVNSTDTQIDMTSLPTGNYIVKVAVDGAIQIVKVVKQ